MNANNELISKVLNDIKQKSLSHLNRHKNACKKSVNLLERSDKTLNNAINNSNNVSSRSRLAIKSPYLKTKTDYFTRLVNSSPKPSVLRSLNHPVSLHLLKLSKSSNYRSYRELVLLSSTKLIKEYCKLNGTCKRVYTTKHGNKLLLDSNVKFEKVIIASKRLLQRIGNVHSYDEGLIAEVGYPHATSNLGLPKLVLCVCPSNKVNIANLCTTMRSAQALQWQAIWILSNNGIDLLDPLSIRSSQNTLMTMPYKRGSMDESIQFARDNNLLLCLCSFNNPNSINIESIDMENRLKSFNGVMLIVGHCPPELYELSAHIYVNIQPKRYINSKSYYTLDPEVHSSIAMYIIKRLYFKNTPRSPFINV